MTEQELQKRHDWELVGDALADLQSYLEENEPSATTTITALQIARDSLYENTE